MLSINNYHQSQPLSFGIKTKQFIRNLQKLGGEVTNGSKHKKITAANGNKSSISHGNRDFPNVHLQTICKQLNRKVEYVLNPKKAVL